MHFIDNSQHCLAFLSVHDVCMALLKQMIFQLWTVQGQSLYIYIFTFWVMMSDMRMNNHISRRGISTVWLWAAKLESKQEHLVMSGDFTDHIESIPDMWIRYRMLVLASYFSTLLLLPLDICFALENYAFKGGRWNNSYLHTGLYKFIYTQQICTNGDEQIQLCCFFPG